MKDIAPQCCHCEAYGASQAALLEAGIKPSGPDSDYDPDATEDEGEDRVEVKVFSHLENPTLDPTISANAVLPTWSFRCSSALCS